jgi:hypothetical protein
MQPGQRRRARKVRSRQRALEYHVDRALSPLTRVILATSKLWTRIGLHEAGVPSEHIYRYSDPATPKQVYKNTLSLFESARKFQADQTDQ